MNLWTFFPVKLVNHCTVPIISQVDFPLYNFHIFSPSQRLSRLSTFPLEWTATSTANKTCRLVAQDLLITVIHKQGLRWPREFDFFNGLSCVGKACEWRAVLIRRPKTLWQAWLDRTQNQQLPDSHFGITKIWPPTGRTSLKLSWLISQNPKSIH